MSTPRDPSDELDLLLAALVDGELTYDQQQHLAALLRDDPALQRKYRDYLLLDALLHWEQPESDKPTRQPADKETRTRSRLWSGRLLVPLAGLAAGLLLAVTFWPRPQPAVAPPDPAVEPMDDTVAVLRRAPGAVWGETELPTWAGAPLPRGWLRLKAGHAHIEFYSGATVILEGPADFRLDSRTSAYCASGKLWATVPAQAQGFTVGTPALDLVDRGTEFGLTVGAGARAEVHVFQGKVELHAPGPASQARPHTELTTGQGVRVDGPGASRPIPSDPAGFLTARDLAERSTAETRRRHQAWLAETEARRRDPSLLVYYPFQTDQPWSGVLSDQARGREQPRDGAIVGCEWTAGRWPGKQALEFRRVSDRVRLHVPDELASVTLAAWVRVDGLPNKNNSLFMSDGWEDGELHWQIGERGKLVLGVQGEHKQTEAHYHAFGVFTPERFGQWIHLAVVYDRDGGRVTHYVDGQPAATVPLLFDIPLRVGDAQIGNWNIATHRNKTPVRYLNGCMDEFMLFSRALSGPEVERLHAQGRPPS